MRIPPPTHPLINTNFNANSVKDAQGENLSKLSDGVRNGSITANEAKTLLKNEATFSKLAQQANADGKISVQESRELKQLSKALGSDIEQAASNNQRDLFLPIRGGPQTTRTTQANQLESIAEGAKKGSLSFNELNDLSAQQMGIADLRSGGPLGSGTLGSNTEVKLAQQQAEFDIDKAKSEPRFKDLMSPLTHLKKPDGDIPSRLELPKEDKKPLVNPALLTIA